MTPAAALADKARAMLTPGLELAVVTDMQSYADRVLVAIARPAVSCVVSIARAEYCGLKLAEIAGWPTQTPKDANAHSSPV